MADSQPAQSSDSAYFLDTQYSSDRKNPFLENVKKIWQRFVYYMRQIWPWVYRLINFLVYETIKVIKGIVKIGLQQVGLFKD